MDRLKEWPLFMREVITNWKQLGAVAPSSAFMARAIASLIPEPVEDTPPRRILEIGGGTGRFTNEILKRMSDEDILVVYEPTETFAKFLDRRIKRDRRWSGRKIELRPVAFPEKYWDEKFDYAVCGLPLNNFFPEFVDYVFLALSHILADGGRMNFFEYCRIRWFTMRFMNSETRKRNQSIEKILRRKIREYGIQRQTVLFNIPPAWIHTLEFKPRKET